MTLALVQNTPKTVSGSLTSVPSLASSAMLVELSISNWSGRKKDRNASSTVTHTSNAETGAASVTKKLLGNCTELTNIQKSVTATRNLHINMTMPWSNTGLRLLPTTQYFKYHERMTHATDEFNTLVSEFLTGYSYEVARAQVKLGDLFNIEDYPTPESLQAKF